MEEGTAGRHGHAPPPSSFVRGEHEFRIVGYSTAAATHYSILSGTFKIGGHTWALDCGFDTKGHLASVFLELLTPYITQDLVVAKASLRIEDPLGRIPAAEWHSEEAYTFAIWSGENGQISQTGSRSWKLSLPDEFRGHESPYVQDDRLTIRCTLEVLQEDDSTIADNLHKLLFFPSEPQSKTESEGKRHTSMLPDVTFVVEQSEIQAHRLVLAMRSPVFAAELLGDMMRESTTRRVRVDDMRASTFTAMVRFIYTDKMPIKAKTADDAAESGSQRACKEKCAARRRVAMACDLLAAADRYDLAKLRIMCEEILYESMDAASVMPTLWVARGRYSSRQLEASCIDYLASDASAYAAVRATDEYKSLQESCNSLVVEVMNKVATHKSASCFTTRSSNPRRAKKKTTTVSTYNTSKVVRGTHAMRIPNFSGQTGAGRRIESNTFQIDGYDWKLVVDPAREEGRIFLFADLFTDPGTTGVRASLCFWMDGQAAPIKEYYSQLIFTRKTPSLGYDFTATKYAEQHYLAHDGSLTIRCSIIVTNNTACVTSAGVGDTTLAPPPSIARHLKELVASEKGSDVTFLVENREIHAHKLLIAATSPVLYEMVAGVANTEVVPVKDMKAAVFKAVLHFIYTGELPPMDDLAALATSGAEDISFEMKEIALVLSAYVDGFVSVVGDMLAAACRFRLDTMKAKCETVLAESILKENARSTLKLARHHNCPKLEDYCDQFMSSRYVAHYRSRAEHAMLERIYSSSSYSRERNSGL